MKAMVENMKIITALTLLLTVMVLSACDISSNTNIPSIPVETNTAGIVTETLEIDDSLTLTPVVTADHFKERLWTVIYNDNSHGDGWVGLTYEDLFNESTYIFEATLLSISFVVKENINFLDNRAKYIDGLQLHTIYEFKPTKIYKGEPAELYNLEMLGGLHRIREDEQYALIEKYGLYQVENGMLLPMTNTVYNKKPDEIGAKYLLFLKECEDGTLRMINSGQYCYLMGKTFYDSDIYKNLIPFFGESENS